MKSFSLSIIFFLIGLFFVSSVPSAQPVSARIVDLDPKPGAKLAFYDKCYLRINYKSDIQLRFQALPYLKGTLLEYGAIEKTPTLQKSGGNEALVWVSFSNPTRIDEVRVNVLDTEWRSIDQIAVDLDVVWNAPMREENRPVPKWVSDLERKEERQLEFVFDPSPQRKETVYNAFFYISVFSIPFYFFLQVQFLRLWRKRWRELAFIPILSITPMIVMSIFGLGMEFRLWVIFIFRGMPLALLYLLVLWFFRKVSGSKVAS